MSLPLPSPCKSSFLQPRSVVFVGLSRTTAAGFLNPMDNLKRWGFQGKIHLVHPEVREISGIPTVRNVSLLEEPADLAVVSTPRETVPGVVEECARKGIRAVIVTNQGFADADGEGLALQNQMVRAARQGGARILGPNTLGVSNTFHRFTTSFMPLEREESAIGVICQSGIFFVDANQLMGGMGIGVDVGNGCDLDVADALEWLGSDAALRVISVHAEGIPRGGAFLDAARRVSARTPVVVLKTGRSPEGARAAASHTGSLTGEDRVLDAALRQAGLLRVHETQELVDLTRGFAVLPPMRGSRVAIVTLTGGGAIVMLDAMEGWGLRPAQLAEHSLDGLRRISPPWMVLGNPMDIWPAVMKQGMKKAFGTALRAALADPGVDGVVAVALGLPLAQRARLDAVPVLQECSEEFRKPIVVWCYGAAAEEARSRLVEQGRAFPVPSLERAIRLLAHMARYQSWKERHGPPIAKEA